MKYLILFTIKVYWVLYPIHKRKKCLFKESCSCYVYRTTKEKGFIKGFAAFKKRFYQCRPGYKLYKENDFFMLYLKNGTSICENDISERLLPPNNYNYSVKD